MFGWFNVKAVDEFADEIVAELVRRYPPSGVEGSAKKATERLRKTHDVVFSRIEKFARDQRLNLYTKARLGNRIKWAMKEAGYPADFIDTLTIEVLAKATLASRKA